MSCCLKALWERCPKIANSLRFKSSTCPNAQADGPSVCKAHAVLRQGPSVQNPDASSRICLPLTHFSNSKQAMSASYTKQISIKWYVIKLLIFFLLRSAQQMKNKLLHFLLLEKRRAKNEFISTRRLPGYTTGGKAKTVQKGLRQYFDKPQDQNTNPNNNKTKQKLQRAPRNMRRRSEENDNLTSRSLQWWSF